MYIISFILLFPSTDGVVISCIQGVCLVNAGCTN